jgi:hypothetical protein
MQWYGGASFSGQALHTPEAKRFHHEPNGAGGLVLQSAPIQSLSVKGKQIYVGRKQSAGGYARTGEE